MTGAVILNEDASAACQSDVKVEELRQRKQQKSSKMASKTDAVESLPPLARPQPSDVGQPLAPPVTPPPFTLEDIRAAIPKHCFERSALRSLGHLAVDVALAAFLGYAATWIGTVPSPLLRGALWAAYWYAQGVILTGVWVLAHECGHGAFSASERLNYAVGMLCHSALLVPFHSWRISHSNHHKNTCSVEHDEVFVAPVRSDFATDMINDTPIVNLLYVINMLTFGWPAYLIANLSGPSKYKGKPNSHFSPSSALFRSKQAWSVITSDMGLMVAFAVLGFCGSTYGWANLAFYYLLPYLAVNAHLVLITYLQHTDTYIPHFRESEFTWLRGALATVDRSFGRLIDNRIHHIADTHVCHHLFHYMPFYHAKEATDAMKKVLGPYYLRDNTSITKALFRSWSKCRFVADDGGIVFYQNAKAF